MKIAYLFDQILPGIATESMQAVNTVSALAKMGCECTLFIPASNSEASTTLGELQAFYKLDGDFHVELVHSIYPGPRMAQKIVHPLVCMTLLRKMLSSFDVVYSRNIPAVAAAVFAGIPAVCDTYRPWPEQYFGSVVPVFKALSASRFYLGMTTHSDYVRDSFIRAGFDPAGLCTARNGYERSHYLPVLSKNEARVMAGLPEDAKIALYTGRFDMRKGLGHVLRLAEARPDVLFVFVGGGYVLGEPGEFEQAARALANCLITGWKSYDEIAVYSYASDVLVIPPTTVPLKKVGHTVLPLKLYSYLAAGRAVYAPFAPDTRELLEHGRNAYLVKPDDAGAALAGFNELIDDPELMERLGRGAAADAEHLTWDDRARVFVDFVQKRLETIGRGKE